MNNTVGLGVSLEVGLLLELLDRTTKAYMKAFDVAQKDIEKISEMQKKYQAFEKVTVYYFDEVNEVVSYTIFTFDWEKYSVIYDSDDPDLVIKRKNTIAQTPERITADACSAIKTKIDSIKTNRNVKSISLIYTYSDNVYNNKELLDKVRKEANLGPHDPKSLKYSSKMRGTKIEIVPSTAEGTLAMNLVL